MVTETLIVGGGLAGLHLANLLLKADRSFLLVESRERFGGRILTEEDDGAHYDMGPAWFWPGQPRIESLVREHDLKKFDQHAAGDLIYQDERAQVHRNQGYASMQGSYRMHGGLSALTQALQAKLPKDSFYNKTSIVSIERDANGIIATADTGVTISAKKVVLTMPPRVAARIKFDPVLSPSAIEAMEQTPTWMAGQAKALATYNKPFWRDDGLSGDAMSRSGPMVEIHDASPANGGPYALFGFIGVPPMGRKDVAELRERLQAQLVALFGSRAGNFRELFIKDWAFDPNTSTERDLQPLRTHPLYGMPEALSNLWDQRVLFGGTEVARQFGGYLEGALEAAENTCEFLHQ